MKNSPAPVEKISPAEARFEGARKTVGLVVAPLVFLTIWLLPLEELKPEAHRLAAVMAAVVVLWVTEALPLPMTALLGAAACVVVRVAPAKDVFAPFADPLMFLFIGSFILARGIFLHRLDRRLAFGVLSLPWVGARPSRILFAFGATTCFLSVFISNTATTAMMFAIGMAILGFLFDAEPETHQHINRRYATALMLMTSFASSIALALPIGTPPNIIGIGFIRQLAGVEVSFFEWALVATPVTIVLFFFLYFYLNALCPAGVREIKGSAELLRRERERLGAWTRGQKSVVFAFAVTIVLWVVPGGVALVAGDTSAIYQSVNGSIPEGVAALVGAGLLFLLPGDRAARKIVEANRNDDMRTDARADIVETNARDAAARSDVADAKTAATIDEMSLSGDEGDNAGLGGRAMTWNEAVKIDWGVVLLYGGGFALGVLSFQTGLAEAVGRGLLTWLPLSGDFGLLVASTLIATLASEATSNTASANMVIPVVISVAGAAGVDPLAPALGATMGSSLGFMLPVSTPCNAIVYGSGYVPLARMIRYGILLDVVGVVVIVAFVRLLTPFLR